MSELFREIEEDIKRERYEKLWKSVGRIAVWGSLAVIVVTTVFVLWDGRAQRKSEEKTAEFIKGDERMAAGDYKGAIAIFSTLSDDDSSPYYAIAMLHKAEAQELSGDKEAAQKTYAALAKKDKKGDGDEFSELAALKTTKQGENADLAKDSPFYHTMAERKAWQMLQSGKKSESVDVFAELVSDAKTPPAMASRAMEVLRVLAPEKLSGKKVGHE